MKQAYLLLLIIVLLSCSDKARESELQSRIDTLEILLEDCQNGASKLLGKVELFDVEKQPDSLKYYFNLLKERHPDSKEFDKGQELYNNLMAAEEEARKEEQQRLKAEREVRLRSLKKLKKRFDDISGVTWYSNPYFTHYNNRNLTSIYMGYTGEGNPWLNLRMSYTGDGWIFFETAILSYDGNSKIIDFDKYRDKETDNSGGQVWEWIDVSVDPQLRKFLREFANSKNAKMRLTGKYTKTRNLTYNERRGILDVLEGFDAIIMDDAN